MRSTQVEEESSVEFGVGHAAPAPTTGDRMFAYSSRRSTVPGSTRSASRLATPVLQSIGMGFETFAVH